MTAGPLDDRGYCAACGYDLRGSAAGRCPECGLTVDPNATPLQLAWERRADVGRVGGFARTARMAAARPGRLAKAVARQLDEPSARLFRRLVLGTVAVTATGAFVAVVTTNGGRGVLSVAADAQSLARLPAVLGSAPAVWWSAGAMVWPTLPAGWLLTLIVGTRWDHWFARPDLPTAVRRRAIAGVRYAVAPLLGWVVVAGLVVLLSTVNLDVHVPRSFRGVPYLLAVVFGLLTVLLSWAAPARYAAGLPGGGWVQAAGVLVGTTVQWAAAITVGLGLLPACVGLVWLVVDSLR